MLLYMNYSCKYENMKRQTVIDISLKNLITICNKKKKKKHHAVAYSKMKIQLKNCS